MLFLDETVENDASNEEIVRWVSNASTPDNSSGMLYVNLEETYSGSSPFLERSSDMISTGRYSPLRATPISRTCLTPLRRTSLLHAYNAAHISKVSGSLCEGEDDANILDVNTYALSPNSNGDGRAIDEMHSQDISQYMTAYSSHIDVNAVNGDLQTEAPILNTIDDVTCSDDVVRHNGNNPFYTRQVYSSDRYEVTSSSSENVYLTAAPQMASPENAETNAQILDTSTDMLMFPSDGFQMLEENNIKTEHVELFISGAQPGVSYSLSKENGLIIARPTNIISSVKNEPLTVDMSVLTTLDEYPQFNTQQSAILTGRENTVNLDIMQNKEIQNTDITLCVDTTSKTDLVNSKNMIVTNFSNDIESIDVNTRKRSRKLPLDSDTSITCIPDKSVPCRAKASLPATHLWLRCNSKDDSEVYGVFARRRIPVRARFGPLEGIRKAVVQDLSQLLSKDGPHFLIHTDEGNYIVDVSDEKTSNWMRYVRFLPGPQQNVCLQQLDDKLYFTSSKAIPPRGELLLGYGITYIRQWNLNFPSLRSQEDDESIEWPCYECPMQFSSSPELQNHLNTHDESEKVTPNRKSKKKSIKCNLNLENHCPICKRTFPRNYSLKRHMRTHEIDGELCSTTKNVFECSPIHSNNSNESNESPNLSDKEPPMDIDSSMLNKNNQFWPTDQQIPSDNLNDVKTELEDETRYECNSCDDSFNSLEEFNKHNLNHQNKASESTYLSTSDNIDDTNLQACIEICENIQENDISTDCIQTERKHVDNSYECPICNDKFAEHYLMKKHIREKHNFEKFQCQKCSIYFHTKEKLQLHMLKHSNNEFVCPNCNKQFKRKDKLKEHIRRQQRIVNNKKEIIYLCSERANGSLSSNNDDTTAYLRFTFKCHPCRLGFKRRGMLVNHLARRHPEISRASVPELQLPILRTARDYFCQHCDKVYKSSSKRKAHILKNHPGESLPPSSRGLGCTDANEMEILGYSACVGSISSAPHHCPYTPCHKQYASKAKLSQHIKHKHVKPTESKENTKIDETTSSPNGMNSETKLNDSQMVNGSSDQISNFLSNMNYQTLNDDKISTTQQLFEANSSSCLSANKSKKTIPPLPQISSTNNKLANGKNSDDFLDNTDKIFEDNLKIPNQYHIDDLIIKTLSEMKNSKPPQDARSNWKANEQSSVLGSLKCNSNYLIHLVDNIDVLNKDSLNVVNENASLLMNDMPKVHISGHIFSVESNKLPPVSILSTNNMPGGRVLATQYTDR